MKTNSLEIYNNIKTILSEEPYLKDELNSLILALETQHDQESLELILIEFKKFVKILYSLGRLPETQLNYKKTRA